MASANTVGAFSFLASGVRADGRPLDDRAGVDGEYPTAPIGADPIHAARRRTTLLLADLVVLRTVTRALEPLRGETRWNAATEVGTLLVHDGEPGLHAVEHRLRVRRFGLVE